MKKIIFFLYLLILLISCQNKINAQIFCVRTGGVLYKVNPKTCIVDSLFTLSSCASELAYCNSTLYGIDCGFNYLYSIDTLTGVTTIISSLPSGNGFSSLVCDGNGNLYAAGNDIYEYNILSNTWKFIGTLSSPSEGDIAILKGQMYMSSQGGNLVKINLNPFSDSIVGPLDVFYIIWGLVVIPDTNCSAPVLYGLGGNSSIYKIDENSGKETLICSNIIPSGSIIGAASKAENVMITSVNSEKICYGSSALLTAFGATSYSWSNEMGTSSSVIVEPTVTTTYTVTGVNNKGCTSTAQAVVTVNLLPDIIAVGGTIPQGQSITVCSSGANTYTWNTTPNEYGSCITVTPTVSTTYTVTGTDLNGCTNTDTSVVFVTSGVKEIIVNYVDINIYPNPTNIEITIEFSQTKKQNTVTIYNINGEEIIKQQATKNKTEIDVRNLPSGIYFVKVVSESGVEIGKFCKLN